MSIEITGTFADGNNARILHAGNRFRVKAVTPSDEVANYPGAAADFGDTVDRWRPFENSVVSPSDLSASDWTPTNLTVASDGLTLDDGTATGLHFIQQAFTYTAVEWVAAAQVERQGVTQFELSANDGSSTFNVRFDLEALTATTLGGGAVGKVVSLGKDRFECRMYFTPVAGTGYLRLLLWENGVSSYTGSNRTMKVIRAAAHPSVATLTYQCFGAASGDCMAIAAHNLGTGGGRFRIFHDSNNDDTFTLIDSLEPGSNRPAMFFFAGINSSRWRLEVSRGALPEVGVFRVGAALKMARPFYAGATIAAMNRRTEVLGNISGSGQLLGRSSKRTILQASYQWQHLAKSWVRANLDGPDGLIQSAETEPFFAAWRPEVTEDVDYVMRAEAQTPSAMGIVDLWTFGISGEALAYE